MLRRNLFVRISSLVASLLFAVGVAMVPSQNLAADEIRNSSDFFKDYRFRSYIYSYIDVNHDNILTDDEINAVTSINVGDDKYIESLEGIEYFTNLEELYCRNNKLESLDLSHNTKLKKLDCSGNKIETLDLSHNPSLYHLDCTSIYLKSVNIKGCQSLIDDVSKGMSYEYDNNNIYGHHFGFVHDFNSKTHVFYVTVTTYVEPLGYFSHYFPCFPFRDVVGIACDKNEDEWYSKAELESVKTIDAHSCGITDLTGVELLTNLETFDCQNNSIKEMDLSKNTKLAYLYCNDNELTDIDLSKNKALKTLSCQGNKCSVLDVSNLPKLNFLDAASEFLKGICFDGSTMLEKVYKEATPEYFGSENGQVVVYQMPGHYLCFNSGIDFGIPINKAYFPNDNFRSFVADKVDPDKNGVLTDAEIKTIKTINADSIGAEDITGIEYFTELTELSCCDNAIQVLDLSKNTKLESLKCYENYIFSLDFSNNKELKYLDCSDSAMEKLNVSKNLKLTTLYCSFSYLDSLDLKNNKELKYLYCQDTKLTKLDITNNPKLEHLYCGHVNLKSLAIYNCPNIIDAYMNGEITQKGTWDGYDWVLYEHNENELNYCPDTELILVKPTSTPTPSATATPTATPAAKPSSKPTSKPTAKPAEVSLTLNKKTANLICGKTLTLKATLKGTLSKITWTSSDKMIATVDANGMITAKMAGEVTITVSAAGKSAKCKVTVLYKDVTNSKDFWYAPTNYLTAKGVVKGYDNQTKFKPANKCTRAQMVTFIWRLQGEPKPKATTCKFKDVKKTDYFYKACIWGNENHIVEGYKDGTFGPQIVCARKHAVTFLWRLADKPKPISSKNKFKDVKKSDYFYQATLWASEKGILAGYSDGTFRPDGDCLRRQMVTFLYKYDKFINGKG